MQYKPRVPSYPDRTRYYNSSAIYHYFDFSIKTRDEFENLKKYIKDGSHLRLLNRINNHDRFAGVLGILPNQLIGLIREVKPEDKDAILKDLRLTSFWHGYRVWRQRAQLDREYWQDKVPNCFKGQPDVLDNCVNAFHYMKLVNSKRAPSLGTCNCSAQFKVSKKKRKLPVDRKNMKIDDWLVKVRVVDEKTRLKRDNNTEAKNGSEEPRTIDLSGDHKHTTASSHLMSVIGLEETNGVIKSSFRTFGYQIDGVRYSC